MNPTDRRTFLGTAAALAASGIGPLEAAAPSETVNVAVLGCGRGANLAHAFARIADSQVVAMEQSLSRSLGTKVRIKAVGVRGRIEIDFYSDAELSRLTQRLSS